MASTSVPVPIAVAKPNWFKRVFEDIFDSKATWEKTAATAITFAGPLVDTIVQLTGGAAASTESQKIIADIQSDLALATKVLSTTSGETAKQALSQYITNVQANLAALLAVAEVKNSAKAAQITMYVNLIGGELQAILAAY
jgi:hypothetical protein